MSSEEETVTKYLIFFNYEKDEVLILDQELPEVARPELYHKGKRINEIDDGKYIMLDSMCLCKWMISEEQWFHYQ